MEGTPTQRQPLFVVGIQQEAERLKSLGYRAISAADSDPADVALTEQGNPDNCGAVLVLSDISRGSWREAFQEAGVHVSIPDAWAYKEALCQDSDKSLLTLLSRDCHEAVEHAEANRQQALEKVLERLHVFDGMNIAMDLYGMNVTRECISTGLANLDAATGGGLPEGALTVLGAGSSSGKTTLAVQVADHIAASGRAVLFVTIEQSRHELVAKSLSRMMKQTKKPNGGYYVASASHIMSAAERSRWAQDKTNALLTCCTRYTQEVAPHMHYLETDGQPTVEQIRAAYKALCEPGKPKPVLLVDYLQLLKAKDERMTDRKAVDVNVMELRQLAREMCTAVLVISSINRQSYSEGAGMGAFKESGGVEYGADLAMMLQPRGYGEQVGKEKTEKAARERAREIMAAHKGTHLRQSELVILKNRGGAMPGKPVPLLYDAMCNLFTEDSEADSPSGAAGGSLNGFE